MRLKEKDWKLNPEEMGKCFKCGKQGKFQTWQFFFKRRHRTASWCSHKCLKIIKSITDKHWKKIYANYHCRNCAGYVDLKEKEKG